ncbi:hypothetical protein IIA16_00930, partial [bacterium]|nr:hypothetical protein [bacterium]
GRFVCLEAEITVPAGSVLNTKWTFTFEWADPTYGPPDGSWKNPGVSCDFGTKDYRAPQPLEEDCSDWTAPANRKPPVESCTDQIPLLGDGAAWSWGIWDKKNGTAPSVACDNRGGVHYVGNVASEPAAEPWSFEFVGLEEAIGKNYCFGSLLEGLFCKLHMWVEFRGGWDGKEFVPQPIAGDNASFRASCACKNLVVEKQSEWTPAVGTPLAIWRKASIWQNPMTNVTERPTPSLAVPYFKDAFVSLEVDDHQGEMTQLMTFLRAMCSPLDSPQLIWFAHNDSAAQLFHTELGMPPRLHQFQLLDAQLIRGPLDWKTAGAVCAEDRHTTVSGPHLKFWHSSGWMGTTPILIEQCDNWGMDDDCRPLDEMKTGVVVHELGHQIGPRVFFLTYVGVDSLCFDLAPSGPCDPNGWKSPINPNSNIPGWSRCATGSVMERSCLFRGDSTGGVMFFNADQIVSGLRELGLNLGS